MSEVGKIRWPGNITIAVFQLYPALAKLQTSPLYKTRPGLFKYLQLALLKRGKNISLWSQKRGQSKHALASVTDEPLR